MERYSSLKPPPNFRILRPSLTSISSSSGILTPGELIKIRERQSRKYMRCLVIFFGIITFLFLLYIPAYHQVQNRVDMRNAGIPGWDYNTSREVRTYVLPDNTTSIHEALNLCQCSDDDTTEVVIPAGPDRKPIQLLIIVSSSVGNFEERNAIRKSWASEYNATNHNSTVRIGFLLGLPENNTLQAKVDEESNYHKDIIQEHFIDSYNNLTLKSVMMLKWVSSHCLSRIKYLMKTDDDMYVNVPNLIKLLNARINPRGILIGSLICGARPIADTKNKWYSPKFMYSGRVYPNYLSGTGYVMSADVVTRLYKAALKTPLLHLEDVYITGLCSHQAHITPRNNPAFAYELRKFDPCIYKNIVTSHKVSPENLYKMYIMLKNHTDLEIKCHLQHQAELITSATSSPQLPVARVMMESFAQKLRNSKRSRIVVGAKSKNNCS